MKKSGLSLIVFATASLPRPTDYLRAETVHGTCGLY